MNGATINHILSTDPYSGQYFQGFSFKNTPIRVKSFPALFILNTDDINGTGEHWCVAFFPNPRECEYFDPFGHPPDIAGIYAFSPKIFNNISEKITYNRKQVQNLNQLTCGHHCIFFSVLRCRDIPFHTILNTYYKSDLKTNDHRAFKYVDNLGSEYAKFVTPF